MPYEQTALDMTGAPQHFWHGASRTGRRATVLITPCLDGVHIRITGVAGYSTGLISLLSSAVLGLLGMSAALSLLAVLFTPRGILITSMMGFYVVPVSLLLISVGALLSAKAINRRIAPLVPLHITVHGDNLTVRQWMRERRIPLADVLAFNESACLIVTRQYQAISLAPNTSPEDQDRVLRALKAAFRDRTSGEPNAIPEALRRLLRTAPLPATRVVTGPVPD